MSIRTEPTQKRIRAMIGGQTIADSTNALMVWEKPYYPTYYLPMADVRMDLLKSTGESTRSPSRGDGVLHDVVIDGSVTADAARVHPDSPTEELREMVVLDWHKMDAWFEEDEQVYVHPRDPYTRIDITQSSREVVVTLDGIELARSTNASFLFETGLPARYYIPKTDVDMTKLVATDLHTECPYKGVASYYSIVTPTGTHENLAWWYPFPTDESAKIAGLVSFYNEKVDITVDGVPDSRPKTVFS